MYKVQLYCSGCRKLIDDRQFNRSKIMTLEKLNTGPWLDFRMPLNGTLDAKFAICPSCISKIDKALDNNLSRCISAETVYYINEDQKVLEETYNKYTRNTSEEEQN